MVAIIYRAPVLATAVLIAAAGVAMARGTEAPPPRPGAASESCFVRGRLLGCNGKPMRAGYVNPLEASSPMAVAKDGSYSLAFPRPGGYLIKASGVHHRSLTIPLLLERPGALEFDIRLSAEEYGPHFDSVRVVGNFNGWADSSAVLMTREPNGTFTAAVNCTTTELRYWLLGVGRNGAAICGTNADTCLIAKWGGFYSRLRRGPGLVKVVFDPRKLPRSGAPPRFSSDDPGGTAAGIAAIAGDLDRLRDRYVSMMDAARAAGEDEDAAHWDWKPHLKAMAARIAAERNPVLRSWRLMAYLHPPGTESDSVPARRVLSEVAPDSPLWSLEFGGPEYLLEQVAEIARAPERLRAYEERMAEAHPDTAVRAAALSHLIGRSQSSGDTTGYGAYYARLMREFPGSPQADQIRTRYAPDRAIQKGKPVPGFSFVDLADTSRVHRSADFRDRHLLIDFWAVWCGPCRSEMKYLHDAYAKYHDRGLEMLSVSFDAKPDEVARFRRGKWAMPWLHAFEPGGFEGPNAKAFEVVSIPRPVLVGPDGRIVAVENELRGEALDRTLGELLPPAAREPSR